MAMSETYELIRRGGEPAVRPPCPNCGRPMHLARSFLARGILPEMQRYSCGECGVSVPSETAD
jgi:ribosomal protein S27AE